MNTSQEKPPARFSFDDLMTVQEVARALRVDDTTIRTWIRNGDLPAISLPHGGKRENFRVLKSVVQEIIARGHAT